MLSLDQLSDRQVAIVERVSAGEPGITPDLLRRLSELGFLPGERVQVTARGPLGGSPIAVRIGTSTFALRLAEARSVFVRLETASA